MQTNFATIAGKISQVPKDLPYEPAMQALQRMSTSPQYKGYEAVVAAAQAEANRQHQATSAPPTQTVIQQQQAQQMPKQQQAPQMPQPPQAQQMPPQQMAKGGIVAFRQGGELRGFSGGGGSYADEDKPERWWGGQIADVASAGYGVIDDSLDAAARFFNPFRVVSGGNAVRTKKSDSGATGSWETPANTRKKDAAEEPQSKEIPAEDPNVNLTPAARGGSGASFSIKGGPDYSQELLAMMRKDRSLKERAEEIRAAYGEDAIDPAEAAYRAKLEADAKGGFGKYLGDMGRHMVSSASERPQDSAFAAAALGGNHAYALQQKREADRDTGIKTLDDARRELGRKQRLESVNTAVKDKGDDTRNNLGIMKDLVSIQMSTRAAIYAAERAAATGDKQLMAATVSALRGESINAAALAEGERKSWEDAKKLAGGQMTPEVMVAHQNYQRAKQVAEESRLALTRFAAGQGVAPVQINQPQGTGASPNARPGATTIKINQPVK